MVEHAGVARQTRIIAEVALLVASCLLAGSSASARASGPTDMPKSSEPRVAVGKCLSEPGLVGSKGNSQSFYRIARGDTVYSRDLLVAIPGLKIALEPAGKNVSLALWGNLPELSPSPTLESAVILHDSKAYDLDLTILRGRVVLTNTRATGPAQVWVRAGSGVQLTLPEPGDSVAVEFYGRWPAGKSFSLKRKEGEGPAHLWEVHCLKGTLQIKAGETEWSMSAAPGLAYFHGDRASGPSQSGPEKRLTLPAWADPRATPPELAAVIQSVVDTYRNQVKGKDLEEIPAALLALANKEKNLKAARAMRQLAVFALTAVDEPEKAAVLLGESKVDEVRQIAVIALRHWIGAREGRDEKLYTTLQTSLGYNRFEAETLLQLLHSPFDRTQPETFETLIAFLKHRRQAIRELAHWHLVRLAPVGREITFDASAPPAARNKGADAWKKLIPTGELPAEKKDDSSGK